MKKRATNHPLFWSLFYGKKAQTSKGMDQESRAWIGMVFSALAVFMFFADTTNLFGAPYIGLQIRAEGFADWQNALPWNTIFAFVGAAAVFALLSWLANSKGVNLPMHVASASLFAFTVITLALNIGYMSVLNIVHLAFILLWGAAFLVPIQGLDTAFLWTSILLIFDFIISSWFFTFIPVVRYLFLIGPLIAFFTYVYSPNFFTFIPVFLLVVMGLFLAIGDQDKSIKGWLFERATYKPTVWKEYWATMENGWTTIETQAQTSIQRGLIEASGGYYEGQVEDNVRDPLGVYLENIQVAETEFYGDEDVIVWASIKARTLDEDNPINIQLSCYADYIDEDNTGQSGTIKPEYMQEGYEIQTLQEDDFSCNLGELDPGSHNIKLFAEFNFPTMAYLKTYFMDMETKRSMDREGIDIFQKYGITDTSPIAVYTNGPVKIGAETSSGLPFGLSKDIKRTPRLGVTIENMWFGKIKQINTITIETPPGIKIESCENIKWSSSDTTGEGFEKYVFNLEGKERYKNIALFTSFQCLLEIAEAGIDTVLGNTPIATRYYRIKTDYVYILESDVNLYVKELKEEEQIN